MGRNLYGDSSVELQFDKFGNPIPVLGPDDTTTQTLTFSSSTAQYLTGLVENAYYRINVWETASGNDRPFIHYRPGAVVVTNPVSQSDPFVGAIAFDASNDPPNKIVRLLEGQTSIGFIPSFVGSTTALKVAVTRMI